MAVVWRRSILPLNCKRETLAAVKLTGVSSVGGEPNTVFILHHFFPGVTPEVSTCWLKRTAVVKVRKALITAAGWGTRFLPVTKSKPKEMLPLLNKPLLQYSVEEAIACGIELVVIVSARGKRSIED